MAGSACCKFMEGLRLGTRNPGDASQRGSGIVAGLGWFGNFISGGKESGRGRPGSRWKFKMTLGIGGVVREEVVPYSGVERGKD